MSKQVWNGMGVMSGTSLDGIDLAWCRFESTGNGLLYNIVKADTFPYDEEMRARLSNAFSMTALEYARLDVDVGRCIADCINRWSSGMKNLDFIASHGHTIFHQPNAGLTTQIGSGAVIAARTGITTVCDFRTVDVALQGQGAPLVPIGDELLFGEFDACLNLGGFANVSYKEQGQRVAFDTSPCNMALNYIASKLGAAYDKDGAFARAGNLVPPLLDALESLPYYALPYPKSLGKEWYDEVFEPVVNRYLADNEVKDVLHTVTCHIAQRVTSTLPKQAESMLVTGGGAHNAFLVEMLQRQWNGRVCVPNDLIVDYKEALVFAFLGFRRLMGLDNCLKSVTGACRDNCGGAVYLGGKDEIHRR